MTIYNYIEELIKLSPRFAQGEVRTAEYIKNILDEQSITFIDHQFKTSVPLASEAVLVADGRNIECRNVGSESGKFSDKKNLISSLYWGENDYYLPQNINFNPLCRDTISMALYYKHAALAINRKDIQKIFDARHLYGKTTVEPYNFIGHNFLVGNINNPKNIIFTHYDCWENGAIDNASGTAVTIHTALQHPKLLNTNLFVIAGNEEISYDEPVYWGRGYRAFEREYNYLLEDATNILLVDCVGYSKHEWVTDPEHVSYGIPLANFDKFGEKTKMLCGNFETLMDVYHSNDDTIELISKPLLKEAQDILLKEIQ